jgi:hypothetical protein
MDELRIWHWIIVLAVILAIYRYVFPSTVSQLRLGIRLFWKRMSEADGRPVWCWQNVLLWTVAILILATLIIFLRS